MVHPGRGTVTEVSSRYGDKTKQSLMNLLGFLHCLESFFTAWTVALDNRNLGQWFICGNRANETAEFQII